MLPIARCGSKDWKVGGEVKAVKGNCGETTAGNIMPVVDSQVIETASGSEEVLVEPVEELISSSSEEALTTPEPTPLSASSDETPGDQSVEQDALAEPIQGPTLEPSPEIESNPAEE